MNTDTLSGIKSSEQIVRLEKLTKRYGQVTAADSVSLSIRKGEFLTLLGPSGSGKTTTLMMIAGFEMPTSGKIFIAGELVVFKPPHKRNIGMVFQKYALFPHMTIFENIAFPLRIRKLEKAKVSEQVNKVLNLVELPDVGGRYPKQLSGGQQQRIALARAIVFNPPVLLMDEPLGALDKKLRENMQLEIKRLHEALGITVIYVTHDQGEALTMSDRIAVMNQGRIEQIGSPTDLYERPKNRFVSDFIGETNLIDTQVMDEKKGRLRLRSADGLEIFVPIPPESIKNSISVAIRPERVSFIESPQHKLPAYQGVIQESIYLGDTIKYKVLIEDKELINIAQRNHFGSKLYQTGDQVMVTWHDEDVNLV